MRNLLLTLKFPCSTLALVAISAGVAAGGCKKGTSPGNPPQTVSTEAPQPSSGSAAGVTPVPDPASASAPAGDAIQVAPPPPVTTIIPITLSDPANMDKTLADLNQALHKYSFERRQMPKSFSEVIAAGYVQPAPQPPPGKKFEIDSKTRRVTLMNQ